MKVFMCYRSGGYSGGLASEILSLREEVKKLKEEK